MAGVKIAITNTKVITKFPSDTSHNTKYSAVLSQGFSRDRHGLGFVSH